MQFLKKLTRFVFRQCLWLLSLMFTSPRRLFFYILSCPVKVRGNPQLFQPTLFAGNGLIFFGKSVKFGVLHGACCYSTYAHVEARGKTAKIIIKDNVWCNNNFMAIADQTSITISEDCLIGLNVEIFDSNFHDLSPERRGFTDPNPQPVFIGTNVFIGNNVKILKGVTIGNNSVIGNASVVTKSIPENVVAAGNPCRVIRVL